MASMLEQEKVHLFLMGLDHKKYNTVRSNILSLEPLPNLNKVYAAIVRVERQLQFTQAAEQRHVMEGAAFKVTPQNRQGVNRPKCSHCKKLGHERHQCYELMGYPTNWGNRRSNRQNYSSGSGNYRSIMNPRNWSNSEKAQGHK